MQAFRQHDYVYLGTPDGARTHRDLWIERGLEVLAGLGLEVEAVVANDPFFGRPGRMLAANQRIEELKLEIVSPICASGRQTAISSSNCHLDHFGLPFGIESGRRRRGPHRVLRFRDRPDHPGPVAPARPPPRGLADCGQGDPVAMTDPATLWP